MLYERKTKNRSVIQNLIPPFAALVIFILVWSLVNVSTAFYVLGGIYLLLITYPFLTYWRTRNSGFLVVTMFLAFAGLVCVSAPAAIEDKSNIGPIPILIAGMYASMLGAAYLTFNRKLKWRGQELFELAALSVEDLGDSFTTRPRPVGRVKFSKTEMIRFVDFMTQNLIAFVFKEENRIVFVLGLPGDDTGYIFGTKRDYSNDTWVAIDNEGNISVNITEEDYLLFKQDFDFDQICQSLGNVIAEFMKLLQEGKENQIIDRMNALRLHPFS